MNLHRSLRGRPEMEPIAVVDIGSNSVRLVVYEGAVRAPTPVFNEKIQCGLGRTLAQDGRLPEQAMEQAITALRRFHALTRTLRAKNVRVLATAAVREASNGAKFISRAEAAIQQNVEILSGEREAELAGAGVRTGFVSPNGFAGDLGGGSLELIDMAGDKLSHAVTLPVGVLRLAGQSEENFAKADTIIGKQLDSISWLGSGKNRLFYPVGGTWRSMAKLHMLLTGYPLRVMHAYAIDADDFASFCDGIIKSALRGDKYEGYEHVSKSRRDLLPYGALVARKLLKKAAPSRIVFSASGIREGLVYSLMSRAEQRKDPLIEACVDLAARRSRSVKHAQELKRWTDPLFANGDIDETPDEVRLREAACLISDIGWRAHPDYRADQSLDTVINSALVSIDHPGRMFLALSIFFRHSGVGDASDEGIPLGYRNLAGQRLVTRARIIAGAVRTAHMLSAGMPGIIDETRLSMKSGRLRLQLPRAYGELNGERLQRRLNALARLVRCEGQVVVNT